MHTKYPSIQALGRDAATCSPPPPEVPRLTGDQRGAGSVAKAGRRGCTAGPGPACPLRTPAPSPAPSHMHRPLGGFPVSGACGDQARGTGEGLGCHRPGDLGRLSPEPCEQSQPLGKTGRGCTRHWHQRHPGDVGKRLSDRGSSARPGARWLQHPAGLSELSSGPLRDSSGREGMGRAFQRSPV